MATHAVRFDETLRRKMLVSYLAAVLVLYLVSVVSAYWLELPPSDARGEVLAMLLALAGLSAAWHPPLRGRRYVGALLCVIGAPVAAVLFHHQIAAQVWSVVPLMFIAMFIRTWHSPAATRIAVAAIAAVSATALMIAPAPVPTLWVVLYALCILGAAEVFGMANTALLNAALRDPLTSVWNRAGIARQSQRITARARRRGEAIAVVVLDVDDFKLVNDQRGHTAGDAVLCDLAEKWLQRLPQPSVIGRVGGDEFVVVLSGYGDDEARSVAAELVDGHAVGVTFGVAVGPPDEGAVDALFALADEDLYRRKGDRALEAGRDAVG
ncbi:diguanylate cyclase [Mycobacterium sp. 852013-51886_SCH5428379]|uniref:GGDEF domain-containing protein n=1 Tax=Mycobacterium sp. 852013-51886_SCH5428379 TaxID=1834111 RepID=UPI0007FE0057|nr:GGDEF domain-containing protein [Mycobacterium sp. 852013-51886_SCH5428379]OBB58217.1 diguanylate cyclase [Mycobacterium sp. 852013-51886_SCH5428379]